MGGKGSKSKKSKGNNADENQTSITFDGGDAKVETKTAAEVKAQVKQERKKSKKEKKEQKAASATKPEDDEESKRRKEEAAKKVVEAQAKNKKISSRLGGNLGIDVSSDASSKEKRTKMFSAPKEEHSRIYNALNPQKLYFESRREKEEAEEEKEVVEFGSRDYGFLRDDDGNIIEEEEEEEEEEEDFDPNNLPDFGEFQKEMDKRREAREAKQREHQAKLKLEYEKKKQAEHAAWEKEVAQIREKERKIEAAKEDVQDGFVEDAQKRVEEETAEHIGKFSFF